MDKFIENVRNKECLWNLRQPGYHNRTTLRKAWEEVEKECGLEAGSGVKKWKNLKDTYRRELRKETVVTSGSTAMQHSKWTHFKDMCFLQDIMELRSMSGNHNNEKSCDEVVEDEDEAETVKSIKLIQPTPKKMKRKLTESSVFSELEKKKLRLLERGNVEEDDDYHYLMSFKKYMKNMGEEKKLTFRIKMQEVLYDVMYGSGNQESPTPVSFISYMSS